MDVKDVQDENGRSRYSNYTIAAEMRYLASVVRNAIDIRKRGGGGGGGVNCMTRTLPPLWHFFVHRVRGVMCFSCRVLIT